MLRQLGFGLLACSAWFAIVAGSSLMFAEIIFGVAILALIWAITRESSARREADRRRNDQVDRPFRRTAINRINDTSFSWDAGSGIGTRLGPCPKCGRSSVLDAIPPMSSVIVPMHDPLLTLNTNRFCPKCWAPLSKICPECDGRRTVTVSPEPGEDRFCSYCGLPLRREKRENCRECGGRGWISTNHDVAGCRG